AEHAQERRQRDRRQPEDELDGGFRAGPDRPAGRAAPQAARDPRPAPRPAHQGRSFRRPRNLARPGAAEHRPPQEAVERPGRQRGGQVMNTVQELSAQAARTEATAGSLLDQIVSATKQTERSRTEDLLRTLTEEALKGTVVYSKNVTQTIKQGMKAIDE